MKGELYNKPCKIYQKLKNIKTIYGHLPPKITAELKLWDLVHVDMIGPYSKSIRQHQTGGAIIKNNVSLTCMKMINPYMGWSGIVKIPTYDLDKVTDGNVEYVDKSSSRLSQLFNITWLSR